MVYSFALIKHANIRYREYVIRLGMYELLSMLHALSIDCEVKPEEMGGCDFLTFESRRLREDELSYLSGHSTICFMAEKTDLLLKPLQVRPSGYLKEDLPEVLKYKGKTSTSFTRMMINICRSLLKEEGHGEVLTLLDPMCGKGTSCFCALVSGMNAIGLDIDTRDIRETSDYFARYLKMHLLKHTVKNRSETAGRTAVPVTEFVFADTKLPNFRFLTLADIRESLPLIDYITPNEDEARYYTGKKDPEEMADVFLGLGVKSVIIKLGGKGCYFKNETISLHLPPCNITAVDATGAGDNFVAGFASEILRGADPVTALHFANACGAICTTAVGAGTALKSREQVLVLLGKR